jgi:hypothetical protein
MKHGIEHRSVRISLVNGLSTVLTLVFQLISVPICLKYWGKESYGSWLALFSAFMLIRSLDGGFTAYVGNSSVTCITRATMSCGVTWRRQLPESSSSRRSNCSSLGACWSLILWHRRLECRTPE